MRFAGRGYLWSRVSKRGQQARVKISPEMFGLNQLLVDNTVIAEERGIVWVFSPYGSPIEWSADGSRLHFLSARTGWNKIWSRKTDGSDLRQETFGECDDRDFQILNDNSLIFVSNRRQKVEWSLWHQPAGGTPEFLFGDWGTVQNPVISPDGKKIALLFSTPTQPTELYVIDRITGKTKQITRNAPNALASSVVKAKVISYPSVRSEIQGLLFVPPRVDSAHRAPAIIRLHGGPSMHDGLSWNSQLQYLASRGFIVLAVNYTGSVGYGSNFEEADRLRIGYEDCDDIAAAARALQALPYVQSDRLGVCGSSYGGYLTNITIGRYPRLFKAAVSWFGISNWITNDAFPRLHPVVKHFFRDRLGEPKAQAALYQYASPVTYADSVRTPLLLAHGDADTVVPIGQSREFHHALLKRGAKVEFSTYTAEGHGWARPETRRDAFRRMEEWFKRYLLEE